MIAASSPASFAAAVAAHVLEDVDIDTSALAGADLVLVGETHGLRETPSVLYALACALDTKAIALEWSHEEMHGPLQEFLRDGSFDFERLWRLPASAELFCGDGRITAGHFALLQRLRREGRLEQVVAFDRLDPEPLPPWQVRDREMAERLLAEWDRRLPLLAVAGAFHAQPEPGTMATRISAEIPRFRTMSLADVRVGAAPAVVPAYRPRA
jgi:hypothetical protein